MLLNKGADVARLLIQVNYTNQTKQIGTGTYAGWETYMYTGTYIYMCFTRHILLKIIKLKIKTVVFPSMNLELGELKF